MPQLIYINEPEGIEKYANMQIPKSDDISKWYTKAKKIIPAIPELFDDIDWLLVEHEVGPRWITWHFDHTSTGERSSVLIDRKYDTIAGAAFT